MIVRFGGRVKGVKGFRYVFSRESFTPFVPFSPFTPFLTFHFFHFLEPQRMESHPGVLTAIKLSKSSSTSNIYLTKMSKRWKKSSNYFWLGQTPTSSNAPVDVYLKFFRAKWTTIKRMMNENPYQSKNTFVEI